MPEAVLACASRRSLSLSLSLSTHTHTQPPHPRLVYTECHHAAPGSRHRQPRTGTQAHTHPPTPTPTPTHPRPGSLSRTLTQPPPTGWRSHHTPNHARTHGTHARTHARTQTHACAPGLPRLLRAWRSAAPRHGLREQLQLDCHCWLRGHGLREQVRGKRGRRYALY